MTRTEPPGVGIPPKGRGAARRLAGSQLGERCSHSGRRPRLYRAAATRAAGPPQANINGGRHVQTEPCPPGDARPRAAASSLGTAPDGIGDQSCRAIKAVPLGCVIDAPRCTHKRRTSLLPTRAQCAPSIQGCPGHAAVARGRRQVAAGIGTCIAGIPADPRRKEFRLYSSEYSRNSS